MAKSRIEFFTDNENLLDFAPQAARKCLPDWFKQMAPSIDLPAGQSRLPFGLSKALPLSNLNATIRRCPGGISCLSEGFIIPLWADFLVQVRASTEADKQRLKKLDFKSKRFFGKNAAIRGLSDGDV